MGVGAAADAFVQLCTSAGFTVVALGPDTFRAARTRRPRWATVTAICTSIFVGIGLFFLLVKHTESGDAVIVEDRAGTKLRLTGQLPADLVTQIANVLSQPAEQRSIAGERSLAERWAPTAEPVVAPVVVPVVVPSAAAVPVSDELVATVPRGVPLPPPDISRRSTAVASPVLVLSDAKRLAVGGGVVIGRAPQPHDPLPTAVIVAFDDVSLSKTHLTVGPAPDGVWVIDHHSTNGTRVVDGMSTVQCVPGTRASAPFGSVILAGELQFTVGAS